MIAKHYVAGFVFNFAKDKVILIEKKRPKWQKGLLNGVGGHIELEEAPLDAIQREFKEETGIKLPIYPTTAWTPIAKLSSPLSTRDASPWECWFFTAKTFEDPHAQTDEEVAWYDVVPLPPNVIDNLHWLIPLAIHGQKNWPVVTTEREN